MASIERAELIERASHLAARLAETVEPRRTHVVAVDTTLGTDYYIVCECGWCSLPCYDLPDAIVCEACEARVDGRRNFAAFARATLRGEYRVIGER